jgi:hypothetical protein
MHGDRASWSRVEQVNKGDNRGAVALCGCTTALAPTNLALAVVKEGRGGGGRLREG